METFNSLFLWFPTIAGVLFLSPCWQIIDWIAGGGGLLHHSGIDGRKDVFR
ncbi:hypothetical protein ACLK2A_12740 [Escherichia coli]